MVEGLVPAIKTEDYLTKSRQRRIIKPKRFDDYCICICMNTLKIPILALIQRGREHLLMVSESRFEALNGGSANYIFLQVVPL
jgi:hypothetical protein